MNNCGDYLSHAAVLIKSRPALLSEKQPYLVKGLRAACIGAKDVVFAWVFV